MKISYEKLRQYNNLSILWLQKNPNNKNTKLGYAIEKLSKYITKLLKPVFDLDEEKVISINDINSDNALTEPVTGKFIYDIIHDEKGAEVQQYAFTPATRKKRDAEIRICLKKFETDLELLLEKEVEFDKPYYATEVPLNLTDQEREAFTGIVIKPAESQSQSNPNT